MSQNENKSQTLTNRKDIDKKLNPSCKKRYSKVSMSCSYLLNLQHEQYF